MINTYDAIVAFHSPSGFGFGLGNVILVGQRDDAVGVHAVVPLLPPRRRRPAQALLQAPGAVLDVDAGQPLNTRHKLYAWITLGTLMLTDFYIMLVASGTISDLRFIG